MATASTAPAEADLLSIVRTLPDVIFRCERRADGKIIWTLNEGKLAEDFHLTTKEIQGKTLEDMFPPDVVARLRPEFEAGFRGEAREFLNELGGRVFKHYPQCVYGPDGKVVALVGFITDVTSLQRAQEQLARANKELETFAYTVSHDLKTPLTVIRNYHDVLLRKHGASLDADARHHLSRMSSSVARMAQIIDDVLSFSRSTSAPLRSEADVPIGKLAGEVLSTFAERDPARAVACEVDAGATCTGDPSLLRNVLENLLGNAWKFTRGTAAARIEFGQIDTEKGPTFFVRDNGAGFDPADSARLFHSFERLHGDRFEGTGIGLSTVARIVQRHGGEIWAEGKPGEGATFCFTLAGGGPS